MWSYRLYRYPSPSSSSLVYGTGKVSEDMSHDDDSPDRVAQAVYRALELGTKLPPLDNSTKVRDALLAFTPPPQHRDPTPPHCDIVNGNSEGQGRFGQNKPKARGKAGNENGDASRDGEEEDGGNGGGGGVDGGGGRSGSGGGTVKKVPFLLLEAISRRRMDAVRQLYEACPQLLHSIPLFDQAERHGASPHVVNSHYHHHRQETPSASATVLFRSNYCPLVRSSRLLDVAAENRALLVFVLQHHPDMTLPGHQDQGCRDHLPGPGQGECCSSPAGKEEEETGVEGTTDPLSELDPTSPITVCLRHNNVEVLQYLMFKHVWQHYLLDEVYKLPHNSQVPDLGPEHLLNACHQCYWFLHCAALVGCSYLLDQVLCGKFCHNASNDPAPLSLDPVLAQSSDSPPPGSSKHGVKIKNRVDRARESLPRVKPADSEQRSRTQKVGGGTRQQPGVGLPTPDGSGPCVSTSFSDDHDVSSSTASNIPESSSTLQTAVLSPENTSTHVVSHSRSHTPVDAHIASSSQCRQTAEAVTSSDPVALTPAESASLPGATALPTSEYQPLIRPPQDSDESLNTHPSTTTAADLSAEQPSQTRDSPGSADPSTSSLWTTCVPDVNTRLSVSLPVMDRWISRCMHVRLAPLHLACWRCDPASIRVLLRHEADVDMVAEELENPEADKANRQDGSSSSRNTPTSNPSSSSSLELALNFVSVTLTSSSLDLAASYSSMEDLLKRQADGSASGGGGGGGSAGGGERGGLTPLAMLALGIRSPPDFSLSIGKSLGLVLPTLPELWGGQVDRGCHQAKLCVMEALHLLLDAGCDVNRTSVVFGKAYRVMELFLQPSVDLYYAPLVPRGGKDSAVLRCMDLERVVGELVLSACWELCARGGCLGPAFASSLEWNLFRMDWMFLQNEALQRRFLHLAVFLGLFPPLYPAPLRGAGGAGGSRPLPGSRQCSAESSSGSVDLTRYTPPPRPSCVPWAPSTSTATLSPPSAGSPAASDAGLGPWPVRPNGAQQVSGSEELASYYSVASTQASLHVPSADPLAHSSPGTRRRVDSPCSVSIAEWETGLVSSQSRDSQEDTRVGPSTTAATAVTTPASATAVTTSSDVLVPSPVPAPAPGPAMAAAAGPAPDLSPAAAAAVRAAQMAVWSREERQRRSLDKLVSDVVRLGVPQSSLVLLLRFLAVPDLHVLAAITRHMLRRSTATTESTLQRLSDAVQQAQMRSLRHTCKLVILMAARWRVAAVRALPLPEALKRYLVDSLC